MGDASGSIPGQKSTWVGEAAEGIDGQMATWAGGVAGIIHAHGPQVLIGGQRLYRRKDHNFLWVGGAAGVIQAQNSTSPYE